ncbi:acetyl-CoA hydrolase/transferase C-terminal domain-containing protein [Oleomonas cavernae]|nr:acetyl-CoA hydrolase/transferase C-terminal domain-containing protein [Oleomonas cavernae]
MRALTGHRDLRIHSGLVGDGVLDLVAAGALAAGRPVTAGVAIGSQALYDAVGGEAFDFQPVSHTHATEIIARIPRFTAINSAIEVDLFGQAYAELTPRGLMSGPGGASDFARGARLSDGGLRIVALPAATGAISRIVLPGKASGLVSLGRFDIDVVATEYGIADLRGRDHAGRAAALIAVAAPAHRESLARDWAGFSARL